MPGTSSDELECNCIACLLITDPRSSPLLFTDGYKEREELKEIYKPSYENEIIYYK